MLGRDIAGYADYHIGGNVIAVEELLRVRRGKGSEVGKPTDGRPMVGVGHESGGQELLDQSADRLAIRSQAAVFP